MAPPMSQVFLASRNRKKIEEMERLLRQFVPGVVVLGLEDVAAYAEPIEDQPTFEGNALLKARAGLRATGLPSLADDSGLCVDALNGMPGVLSARWSGQPKDDQRNNRLLLEQLVEGPRAHRCAQAELQLAVQVVRGLLQLRERLQHVGVAPRRREVQAQADLVLRGVHEPWHVEGEQVPALAPAQERAQVGRVLAGAPERERIGADRRSGGVAQQHRAQVAEARAQHRVDLVDLHVARGDEPVAQQLGHAFARRLAAECPGCAAEADWRAAVATAGDLAPFDARVVDGRDVNAFALLADPVRP